MNSFSKSDRLHLGTKIDEAWHDLFLKHFNKIIYIKKYQKYLTFNIFLYTYIQTGATWTAQQHDRNTLIYTFLYVYYKSNFPEIVSVIIIIINLIPTEINTKNYKKTINAFIVSEFLDIIGEAGIFLL